MADFLHHNMLFSKDDVKRGIDKLTKEDAMEKAKEEQMAQMISQFTIAAAGIFALNITPAILSMSLPIIGYLGMFFLYSILFTTETFILVQYKQDNFPHQLLLQWVLSVLYFLKFSILYVILGGINLFLKNVNNARGFIYYLIPLAIIAAVLGIMQKIQKKNKNIAKD